MELRGGNIYIIWMLPRGFPLVPLEDGLIASATLDEKRVPDIVGG
jgi:hypothetical protein